jgi:DNA-binding beta-propeller fold protein YncE
MRNWLRTQTRRRPAAPRVRLDVECLEERRVPAGLNPGPTLDAGAPGAAASAVATVFIESNDPVPGENAVLALRRGGDGSLVQTGTFRTHGTGQLNIPKVVGPDDSSQEVVATPDGRFLFAVNQGSNTIAAFRILRDGDLRFIDTFDSGGVQPDSLGIAGGKLYVSNRGDATAAGSGGVPAANPGTVAPDLTGLTIGADGRLAPIPGSTVTLPVGTVPSQNLIAPDGRFLFSDIFGVNTAPQSNTLAPFDIQGDGSLRLAPGGNVAAIPPGATGAAPALLGAAANPKLPIVYAGLTGLAEVAVFTYDATGRLTFVGATAPNNQGGSAPCWAAVSPDGKFLYTGDTGSDSVGVYSLADPLHPVQLQELFVGGPHTPPGSAPGTPRQTAVFQVAVDPSGRFVYAISQTTNNSGTFPSGNQLHILSVARDGTLTEAHGPALFSEADVPGIAHVQGIAVVPGIGAGRGHDEGASEEFFGSLRPGDIDVHDLLEALRAHRDV